MSVADGIGNLVRTSSGYRSSTALPAEERDAILEVAFLAVAADRHINAAEEDALRALARALDPPRAKANVDALLARGVDPDRDTADAHLLTVVGRLATDAARALAYQGAYAVAQADLAAADEEFEFDLQLIDALGLDQDTADQLAQQVVAALYPPPDAPA
jgi:hypothetical protein